MDYWLEIGACLTALWLTVILTGVLTVAIYNGIWVLALLYPPLVVCFIAEWHLWKTRPSLHRS